jgi:hypothetical protein
MANFASKCKFQGHYKLFPTQTIVFQLFAIQNYNISFCFPSEYFKKMCIFAQTITTKQQEK